eukprot:g19819.t1
MTCGELIGSDAHTDSYVQGLKRLVSVRDAQIAEQKRKESKLRADLLWMRGQTEHLVQLVLDESAIVRSSKEQSSSTIQPAASLGFAYNRDSHDIMHRMKTASESHLQKF